MNSYTKKCKGVGAVVIGIFWISEHLAAVFTGEGTRILDAIGDNLRKLEIAE